MENHQIEIVDFPMQNDDVPQQTVRSLPDGIPQSSSGIRIQQPVNTTKGRRVKHVENCSVGNRGIPLGFSIATCIYLIFSVLKGNGTLDMFQTNEYGS